MAVPLDPTNLIASVVGQNDVDLTWQDNAVGESGYVVERRDLALVQPPLIHQSDWRHGGVGGSDIAVLDDGRWLADRFTGDLLAVALASASPATWPVGMERVLQHVVPAGGDSGRVRVGPAWPSPGDGEFLFFRIHMSANGVGNGAGDLISNGQHTFEPVAGPCAFGWQWQPLFFDDGTWDLALNFLDFTATQQGRFTTTLPTGGSKGPFAKLDTLRIEWMLQGLDVANDLYDSEVRLYDQTGALIADGNDFENNQAVTLADQPSFQIFSLDAPSGTCLQWLTLGHPGFAGVSEEIFWELGGSAVSVVNWIGPYVPGEEAI